MLIYPNINPIALHLGSINIYWYGIMYLIGFLMAWLLLRYRHPTYSRDEVADIIFYSALGVIIGGRLGCVLFFGLSDYLANPWEIFAIWRGGMSFHGGLLGVMLALYCHSRRYHRDYLAVMDAVAPVVPLGLGAGRLGNFINGELWGRVTDMPWGMVFPHVDEWPRHPSQLYEFFLEGILLFIILWIFSAKTKPRGTVCALFLIGYGIFRFAVEFVRDPDPPWHLLLNGWLTMGQLLSVPMVVVGLLMMVIAYRSVKRANIS